MSASRDWRVGHQGRDMMHYEERNDGEWHRIDISGEMLTGRAHHVIYFASPSEWQRYPAWARDRRDEIIARIKSEFAPPDYEYHEPQDRKTPPSDGTTSPPPPVHVKPTSRRSDSSKWAVWVAILALVVLVIAMGFQVQYSATRGATRLPVSRGGSGHTIRRADQPALFWVSVGLYGSIGIGALGVAIWLLRANSSSRPNGIQPSRH